MSYSPPHNPSAIAAKPFSSLRVCIPSYAYETSRSTSTTSLSSDTSDVSMQSSLSCPHTPTPDSMEHQAHDIQLDNVNECKVLLPFPSDRYILIRTIHATLMGAVYLYQDKATCTLVAVKRTEKSKIALNNEIGKVLEDPIKEMDIMNYLNSACMSESLAGKKNCLISTEQYEDSEYFYTVLPYADQGELFDVVSKMGRMEEQDAKHIIVQVLRGLSYLHRVGVAHLDVSLENILLSGPDAHVYLADYGVSRWLSSDDERVSAASSAIKPGKTQYMAPEIYMGGDYNGRLADTYSAGVVLFMMMYGVPPYRIPNAYTDKAYQLIIKGQLELLLRCWRMNHIGSAELTDFLGHMLCEERSRWSVERLLQHPWVTAKGECI